MTIEIGDILAPPEDNSLNTIYLGLGAFIIIYLLLKDKKREKKESELLKLFDLGK